MAKVFIPALILCCLAGAPFAASAEEHKTLKIGVSQYPSTLHPFFDEMVAKSMVLGGTQRPVTAYDADWKPVCMLCTELPSYENGRAKKDGTGIAATYTLKDNLFWGDGKPVTTKDILFAYEVGKHPKSGVGNGEFFTKDITHITADDAQSFTIHYAKEKCDFAPIGDFYALPEHLERKIFEQDPETYKNRTLYNTAPATAGLWMGPYQVTKVESGASITLEKNPNWKGPAPHFDKIVWRTIDNSAALQANLLSGDVDYIPGELGIMLDEALSFEKRLKATKPGRFTVTYNPSLTYEHIDLPVDRAPFNDLRLRQALMYAIDRAGISSQLFGGKQPVALSNMNPRDTVYTSDVPQYPYDPAKAAELLDAAGFTIKDDGYRYGKDGKRLVISLATTAGNKTRELIAVAIKSDLKKVGVDIAIDTQPARVLFGDTMRERKFTGGAMYAWMSAPQSIPKTTLYSKMVPTKENNWAGQNYTGYANPAMDKLIDDLDVVCAADKNLALWHQLQKTYAEELPALPLYYRADSYFMPVWLKGVTPTGHLHPSPLWIENWSATP
ncbi:MAG TPA: peptide ABC transporter substrate-binding protein [Patescibacteria group bacterium]|nr:peptide ABC transporter substrate-binding protein [Patescibacteria group bacterium]